jgi:hypothetical protein
MRAVRELGVAVAIALMACPAARADGPLPDAIYDIKQSVPTTGTRIPRRVVTSNVLPLNRRWAELTQEEQGRFKSNYEAMRPLDEPPFPVDGLKPLYDNISQVQHKVLAQGDLVMDVEIDATGQAQSFSVIKSPDPELSRAVATVLALTRFKPAVCSGQPCRMGFPFRMSFSVDR